MKFGKVFMKNIISSIKALLTVFLLLAMASCTMLKPSFKGTAFSSSIPAAEIKLTDHNGQPFQLSNFRGRVVLVFFGFSNCVNECPVTLAIIRKALEEVGDASKDVDVVMVSTDPANDTSVSMREFMGRFNPAFLGLLGAPDELAKAWSDYGVVVEDGGETHSSLTYVVDRNGNLRETFSLDLKPEDVASDLKILLEEN